MPAEVEALLRSLNTSDRARAAAFDAVYNVQDDGEAQKVIGALPFSDDVKATLWDARHGQMPQASVPTHAASQQQPSALSRFASNAWEMVNPVAAVKGLASAAMHPVNTAKSLYNAQAGQFSQAADLAGQGRYIEALGHGIAGITPIAGPIAAQAGEQIAQGDIAGGLGKGAGLLAPLGVKPAVQGVRAAIPASARAAAAEGLEAGARRRVVDVMAPTVGPNKVRFGK